MAPWNIEYRNPRNIHAAGPSPPPWLHSRWDQGRRGSFVGRRGTAIAGGKFLQYGRCYATRSLSNRMASDPRRHRCGRCRDGHGMLEAEREYVVDCRSGRDKRRDARTVVGTRRRHARQCRRGGGRFRGAGRRVRAGSQRRVVECAVRGSSVTYGAPHGRQARQSGCAAHGVRPACAAASRGAATKVHNRPTMRSPFRHREKNFNRL